MWVSVWIIILPWRPNTQFFSGTLCMYLESLWPMRKRSRSRGWRSISLCPSRTSTMHLLAKCGRRPMPSYLRWPFHSRRWIWVRDLPAMWRTRCRPIALHLSSGLYLRPRWWHQPMRCTLQWRVQSCRWKRMSCYWEWGRSCLDCGRCFRCRWFNVFLRSICPRFPTTVIQLTQ